MNRHRCSTLIFNFIFFFCLFCPAAFGQPQQPVVASFEVANNLVLVKTSVNGSEPLMFVLDTGASMTVISERAARQLNLKLAGQANAATQGGSIGAAFVDNVSLQLANRIKLPAMTVAAVNLNGLEAGLGRTIDGVLGFEIFNLYTIEIDQTAKLLKFHEPQNYKYAGRGQIVPITIEDNTPYVRGAIVPVAGLLFEGKFLIDTGATGATNLNSPFVAQHELLGVVPKTKAITFGALLANKSAGRVGRMQSLQFGGFTVANPIAILSQDAAGDDASADFAGVIGGEILRRFNLVIDYERGRIIFEPNKQFAEAYEFDMSGASLAAAGDGLKTIKVRSLIENSPAAKAGLRVGDSITAVNGVPTTKLRLEQIRRMFKQPAQPYRLRVERGGGKPLQITITTRRLV